MTESLWEYHERKILQSREIAIDAIEQRLDDSFLFYSVKSYKFIRQSTFGFVVVVDLKTNEISGAELTALLQAIKKVCRIATLRLYKQKMAFECFAK